MRKIAITQGEDAEEGAFCQDTLDASGVSAGELATFLADRLRPFAALLKSGHGVAVVRHGDEATIIGIDLQTSSTGGST